MPNHIISLATIEDLPEIVAIYNSTVESRQSTADLEPTTVAAREAWFHAHTGNRPLYVVRKKESPDILAWGSFSDYYPRHAYRISAEISVYVRHDTRGMGMGRVLVQYMLERAPSLGIRNVIGVIFGHNHPSIRLFHSFGFEEWGRLPQVCDMATFIADVVILGKRIVD